MRYLLIGGAGFIGVNAADRYSQTGHQVTILDNFARPGAEENANWLLHKNPKVRLVRADIRTDQGLLAAECAQCDVAFHLAAQVAVTTSVANPRMDFEINALGTLNVLESARQASRPPIVLYSSTNKVYGGMENVAIVENGHRYAYGNLPEGVSEQHLLDFHSPYGCSKGTGDQYVRDYARIYGMRTVVFRQSCIYGPHQFGIEDQGWLAWFALRGLMGQPVCIYGDGKQVRDVLFIDDLLSAFDRAIERMDRVSGQVFNIGGGPQKTLSLLELVALLEKLSGKKPDYSFSAWRPGDQRVYISDIRKAQKELDWSPQVGPEAGVQIMRDWMSDNLETIQRVYQG